MKTLEFGQHLIQLSQSFPPPTNAFLVKETDGLTLIDTRMPGNARAIINAAKTHGTIRRIALTHDHFDHAGSLDELHALLPHAEILVGVRESRLMRGDRTLEAHEPQNALRGTYITPKTQPDQLLNPGDRLGSLRVFAAPGHTPGQIAFLDERDGTLIAGDAWQIQGGIAVAGTPKLAFPFLALATWDRLSALETARQLRALRPERLAVGHGDTLEKPLAAMNRAIEEAERQIKSRES